MKTYDININENNELVIDLYNVNIRREGKNSFYDYNLLQSFLTTPEDISTKILNLSQENNVFSSIRINPTDFHLDEGNAFYTLYSNILPLKNKLLEKVYDEVIIDVVCHIFLYVTYINVFTGEISAIKVNDLGIYSQELESYLEKKGYKYIPNSFLGNYLNNLDSQKSKPFVLNRRRDS